MPFVHECTTLSPAKAQTLKDRDRRFKSNYLKTPNMKEMEIGTVWPAEEKDLGSDLCSQNNSGTLLEE